MLDHLTQEELAGFVLQTITDAEREHLARHLQRCPDCRTNLSRHEATVRRIRTELVGDLRQLTPSPRSAFAKAAPHLKRSRHWSALRQTAARSLAAGPQLAVWLAIIVILILVVQRAGLSEPGPTADDATFENRDLRLHTEQPGLAPGPRDAWDDWYANPGQALFHDGKFHMFYSGKSVVRHIVNIGYATSVDGINWTRESPDPVLTTASISWTDEVKHVSANTAFVEGGQWTLYFTASRVVTLLPGQIGRATAPTPLGPWTVHPQPVLTPGPSGEWDAGLVSDACVVRVEDSYVMYYTGGIRQKMIGRAVSADGLTWTKYDDPATTEAPFAQSDPVLQADVEWEAGSLEQACPQWAGSRWVTTYTAGSASGIGYAVSADGIRWFKSPQNPIIRPDELGRRHATLTTSLAIHDQTAFLYFQPNLIEVPERGLYAATWREP